MRLTNVSIDIRFENYFRNLRQVFLYITDDCNLRCVHCLYRPWLTSGKEMDSTLVESLLVKLRDLGAVKLSLLGGEPTLYGRAGHNKSLPSIIAEARGIGYKYIRLVTNGLFDEMLLLDHRINLLDEITFSVDGDKPEIHDCLRGSGSFERSVRNMNRAILLGYKVDITSCVHRGNVGRDEQGNYIVDRMIRWAAAIGASRINFHPLFRMGVPRDSWTGETDISPAQWVALYSEIRTNIDSGRYNIPVRIPQRFVTREEFDMNPSYYDYCPVKTGDRVLVHRNGQIQICALMNGVPVSIARFIWDGMRVSIMWETKRNELEEFSFVPSMHNPCPVMRRDFGNLVPLCISFKPKQDEFVWRIMGMP